MTNTLTQVPTVGQSVRYVGDAKPWITYGKSYEIISIDEDGDAVFFDDDGDETWVMDGRNLHQYELVSSATLTQVPSVGQVVRYVGEDDDDVTFGETYEITDIDCDGDAVFIDDVQEENYIDEYNMDDFELVTPVAPKSPTFEIGDKVRMIDKNAIRGAGQTRNGETYEVVALHEDGDISIDDKSGGEELVIWKKEMHAIEKVESAPSLVTENNPKGLAVGDKVRVVDPSEILGGLMNFYTGEITEVQSMAHDYITLKSTKSSVPLLITQREQQFIEKVEGKVAEEKKGETKVYKFKAGDKVELLDTRGAMGGFVKGEVYTITAINHTGYHDYALVAPNGTVGYTNESSLKLATPQLPKLTKMPKKGDVVRASRTGTVDGIITQGKDYTIIGTNAEGNAYYEGDDGRTDVLNANTIAEWFMHEFDLVSEAPNTLTKMPKVGDVIRYISEEDRKGLTTGKEYEIIEIDSDGDANFVSDFGEDFFGGLASVRTFTLGNYELVSEAPEETPVATPGVQETCGIGTALEARVEALEARLHALETGNVDIVPSKLEATLKLSDNLLRKKAIEKAEASLTAFDSRGSLTGREGFMALGRICDAEFIVDKEKRTVVCLLKGQMSGDVRADGVAKCDPTDVFNVTIGKAIALGRARELDVTEFAMAPQPTVAVGQKVDILDYFTQEKTDELGLEVVALDGRYPKFADGMYATHFVITDDTDAKY